MAKAIDVSAVIVMVVVGVFLFFASLPIPGAIGFVGMGKTAEEIKRAEQRRKRQRCLGFALLIVGGFVQVLRLFEVLR